MPWKRAASCATGPRLGLPPFSPTWGKSSNESVAAKSKTRMVFGAKNVLKWELFGGICVLLNGGGYKLGQVVLSRTLLMHRSDNPVQPQGNPRKRIALKEPMMIALETLRTHKLRSFLTLLGVILSVSTLI